MTRRVEPYQAAVLPSARAREDAHHATHGCRLAVPTRGERALGPGASRATKVVTHDRIKGHHLTIT